MHCQVVILEKQGMIHKRISDAFNQLIKGYDLLQCYTVEEVLHTAKKRLVDIIAVNGDDFLDTITSGKPLKVFKERIRPLPKIILFLELKLIKVYPALEKEADIVIDSGSNLSFVEIERIFSRLLGKSLINGSDFKVETKENAGKEEMTDYDKAKQTVEDVLKQLKGQKEK